MKERIYNAKNAPPAFIEPVKNKRHYELDLLRGICVLLMVIDHFFYSSMAFLPSVWDFAGAESFWLGLNQLAKIYWNSNARSIAQYTVVSVFFLVCGVSCTLSRNNALRGLKTLAAGLLITTATYLADSFFNLGALIVFGVIHMLGCSILLFSLFDLAGWGIQKLIGRFFKGDKARAAASWTRKLLPMAAGIIGLIIFFALPIGYFGKSGAVNIWIGDKATGEYVTFPPYTNLFSNVSASGSDGFLDFLSIFVEIKNYHLGSADYFPIIPNGLMVLVGSGIGRLVYETKARKFSDYILLPPLGIAMLIASCIRRLIVFVQSCLRRSAEKTVPVKTTHTGFLIRPNLDGKWNKPVCFIGRRALIVYLLHQIVIVAFFYAAGGIFSLIN